jgi:hypothetical protein
MPYQFSGGGPGPGPGDDGLSEWEHIEHSGVSEQELGEADQVPEVRSVLPADWEKRDQGLSEWEHSERSGLTSEEQEEERLKNTTPLRVLYIVVGMALLLLLIVGILGANVFHFW